MARVRQRDTAPEVSLRRALHACGLRFRVRFRPALPGSPDVIFPAAKVAVFVDGCFWHGCPVHGSQPKTNPEFWADKIRRNQQRDREVGQTLERMGWLVLRFWEHDVLPDPTAASLFVWATVRSR